MSERPSVICKFSSYTWLELKAQRKNAGDGEPANVRCVWDGRQTFPAVSPASAGLFHRSWSSHMCCKYSQCSYSTKTLISCWAEMEPPFPANSFPSLAFQAAQIEKGRVSQPQWCAGKELATVSPERRYACAHAHQFILNFPSIKTMWQKI